MTMLFQAMQAEVIKMRRTLALVMTFIAPLFIALLIFAMFIQHSDYYVVPEGVNPWMRFSQNIFIYWNLIMAPLYITLETALLSQLEHSHKNWKLLYTLPIRRWAIYAGKQIISMALIALSMVFMTGLMVGTGKFLQILMPKFGFDAPIPWTFTIKYVILTYLASWFMVSFHLWVSTRWNSFVLAIAVGIVATVVALFCFGTDYSYFYPWTMPGMISVEMTDSLSQWAMVAAGTIGGILVAFLGGLNVIRRDVL
jgi:hypothetical protein